MSVLRIRLLGDPVLRKKSVPVNEVGSAERVFIKAMIETMYGNDGVGLAAPQVGVNKRIFVEDVGDGPMVVVNPRIIKKTGKSLMEEGCLSLPGIMVRVARPEKIIVEYLDEHNILIRKECDGLMARAFLHEIDHLDGKLLIDHASFTEKLKLRKKVKELVHKTQKSDHA